MAKPKQPALSTQVKTLTAQVAELEKKLAQEKASKDGQSQARQEKEAEIEQVHALLDALPGAAGRKTAHEEAYYRKDLSIMTRLASYLAARSTN